MDLRTQVLITGGAGFIGSHLSEKLVKQGVDVICLDNFFTGSRRNIEHLLDYKNFELIRHDIIEPILLEADEIYNLACPASPIHYQFNPVKTVKTNVMGAINVLGLADQIKARVLQASTSEVYGDPEVHPQVESYRGAVNTIGPRACYDEGKRCAETVFFDYHREDNVDIKVVRIFNTYGPHMHPHDGRVVSNFIVQALRNEDITIFGEGNHTRSFCYVDDLVDGMIKMMASPKGFTGPVNLGNPQENTILELAETIINLTGSSSSLIHKELPQDDPQRRKPDIGLAREKLDWSPTVSLKEGLIKTISYFEDLLSEEG
ncbi:MAG: UDP-glucuronic acid decarboxylase family protein [Spirochaetia bacterium]|nr:UDP-glucuronic acid decarboxylase family protein [Spirochaetia bacterium]